jgi:PAT family beta-lactamase induction signal transducer AmpG
MPTNKKLTPWAYIPTLYFAEGLPYMIINIMSVAMFKSFGVDNEYIGLTSLFYLPWMIKPIWSPIVDGISTKRNWLLTMNFLLGIVFIICGSLLFSQDMMLMIALVMMIGAFISATHDIAIDGYYLHALSKGDQAFFSGIRSTFYRLAMIFGSGFLVVLAGRIAKSEGYDISDGWIASFMLAGLIFFIIFVYQKWILPKPETDLPITNMLGISFVEAFSEYFKQKKIFVIIAFILSYRLGEGLLVKMAQPFLMDSASEGGFGIGVEEIGIIYGTFGVLALVIGGILGGVILKKVSLKNMLLPMALAMNLPNLLYYFLSFNQAGIESGTFLIVSKEFMIQSTIIIEQFGYGFGFTSFMVYLLHTSKGKYKSSHYAISTGIMALGMMIPGTLSGYLESSIGYTILFAISFLASIPGMLIIFYLPHAEN